MKKSISLNNYLNTVFLLVIFLTCFPALYGQKNDTYSINGHLHDGNMAPVQFATIALGQASDSVFITGTMSDINGDFSFNNVAAGKYRLHVSNLGYETAVVYIELKQDINAGNILLKEKISQLQEVVISGEKIKATKEADKTTYLIDEKLQKTSDTGSELLSFIPGIAVDLRNNISLNGKTGIIILVNGIERDNDFVNQLNPETIEKVELMNSSDNRFDSSSPGAVNIILKEKVSGLSGYAYAEAPLAKSVYSFPSYNLNLKTGRLELYTSYNGSMSYFDIVELENRRFNKNGSCIQTETRQYLRQKDWSHKFHIGADLRINDRNQLNFYGYLNPYSREFDGQSYYHSLIDSVRNKNLYYIKDDNDRNNSDIFSVFYSHTSITGEKTLSLEANFGRLIAENSTSFIIPDDTLGINLNQSNSVRPFQRSGSIRADFTSLFSSNLKLEAGAKARLQMLHDRNKKSFRYVENIYSIYSTIVLSFSGHTLKSGFRSEYSISGLTQDREYRKILFLPRLSLNLKISPKQNLELSYNSTVSRPNIYQLNPYVGFSDPDGVYSGNPDLHPERSGNIILNYSILKGSNFYSGGLFFTKVSNAINQWLTVNDNKIFETHTGNLGTVYKYGIQFTGALRITEWFSVNNSTRLFRAENSTAVIPGQNNISSRHWTALESGISVIGSFKHDISASFRLQYNSPVIKFQSDSFSDALWFISVDKTVKENLTLGIASALPLMKSFTYHGSKISGDQLNYYSEGKLQLPICPAWIKIRYQFSSGARTSGNYADHEDIINIPKKGM